MPLLPFRKMLAAMLCLTLPAVLLASAVVDDSVRADDAAPQNADEPVFSGPQPGEKLPPLVVQGVFDDEAGRDIDMIKRAGDRPHVIVFFHERTRPAFGVANALLRYVGQQEGIAGSIVYLTADATETERWLKVVRELLPKGAAIGVSKEGVEGPGAYGLNRNVALTILVAKEGKVTANFALVQPSLQADLPKIVRAVADSAGIPAPRAEALLREYGGRMAAERPNANRPDAEDFDPRTTLGPVIRANATPEEVDEAAKRVDKLAAENETARRRIGEIARRIVDAGKLENYGTRRAQEHLARWAKEFADKDEPPKENEGASNDRTWPPRLRDAVNGTVELKTADLLRVPASVEEARVKPGAAPFVVAETPPRVELAFHDQLGPDAEHRRLWSSWGDICVASDGRVYCGIGDHGDDVGGDARCFVYRWDPKQSVLEQVVDMNQVVPPKSGRPSWSKIHAKIDEGPDGRIYFSCTLNDGNRAKLPTHHWDDELPGGQLYAFDPASGEVSVVASLPPRRCTATSILDRRSGVWWCNLEAGDGDALWGLDLKTAAPVVQTADGVVSFNRNFALAADGSILFNGAFGEESAIAKLDPKSGAITRMKSTFGDSPGMRSSTSESRAGEIFGVTHKTNQLFRYRPAADELSMLGPSWLEGAYTTVCILSSDERFVYYLPGSHGGAFRDGTPIVQYDIARGQRKVLAFLAPACEAAFGCVPAGTYGAKLSDDGAVLYINFNGHAADPTRPAHMKPNGFGLCAFAAIHIPEAERD